MWVWLIILGIIAFIGIGIIGISFDDNKVNVELNEDKFGEFVGDVKENMPIDITVTNDGG